MAGSLRFAVPTTALLFGLSPLSAVRAAELTSVGDATKPDFFEATPVDFPVLLNRDRTIATSWKISAPLTTCVFDANMKPVFAAEADFAWDTIDVDPATGKLTKRNSSEIRPTRERLSNLQNWGSDHDL
jgi:hypothetical protein